MAELEPAPNLSRYLGHGVVSISLQYHTRCIDIDYHAAGMVLGHGPFGGNLAFRPALSSAALCLGVAGGSFRPTVNSCHSEWCTCLLSAPTSFGLHAFETHRWDRRSSVSSTGGPALGPFMPWVDTLAPAWQWEIGFPSTALPGCLERSALANCRGQAQNVRR